MTESPVFALDHLPEPMRSQVRRRADALADSFNTSRRAIVRFDPDVTDLRLFQAFALQQLAICFVLIAELTATIETLARDAAPDGP
jgi:hypothetical protein